jgi:predicted porin
MTSTAQACYVSAVMNRLNFGGPLMTHEMAALVTLGGVCLCAHASAQEIKADVEVYGVIVPHVEYIDTDGATPSNQPAAATQVQAAAYTGIDEPARFRMTQGTSHLGFRGTVDILGDDLKVVWQIESGVPVDGELVANTLASRNSHVGVSGFWGTAFFGTWDNPYKWASLPVINPIRAGFVPDYTAIIATPGFAVGALNLSPGYVPNAVPGPSPVPRSNAAFYRRDSNSIQYWSPSFYGVSARVSYTANEFSRAGRPAGATTPELAEISPDIISGLLSYDNGPLKLRYAMEIHRDYFGLSLIGGSPGGTVTNPSSRDIGQQGVAAYTFTFSEDVTTRLVATFDYLFYENDDTEGGNVDQYERAGFYGLVDQSYGKHHLWAAYGEADAGDCSVVGSGACSTDGLGARMMTMGYLFRLSPHTDFYAAAYQVVNKRAATYAPFPPIDPLPAPGANLRSFGIGMLHHFSATASTSD